MVRITLVSTMKHRAIISLNNSAVTLMRRNRFVEAVATFHEAVCLAKSASTNQSDIDKVLHECYKRTSLPPPVQYDSNSSSVVQCRVISSQDTVFDVVDVLRHALSFQDEHQSFENAVLVCMIIDPVDNSYGSLHYPCTDVVVDDDDYDADDYEDDGDSSQEHFNMAILLYNFAQARYGLTLSTAKGTTSSSIRNSAYKKLVASLELLRLSEKMLSLLYNTETSTLVNDAVVEDNDSVDDVLMNDNDLNHSSAPSSFAYNSINPMNNNNSSKVHGSSHHRRLDGCDAMLLEETCFLLHVLIACTGIQIHANVSYLFVTSKNKVCYDTNSTCLSKNDRLIVAQLQNPNIDYVEVLAKVLGKMNLIGLQYGDDVFDLLYESSDGSAAAA